MTKKTVYSILLVPFIWLALTSPVGAQQSQKAKAQPGTFQMKVNKGLVSLEANEAPVAKIFEEIGKQAGIVVDSNIGPEEKITIQFDQTPLEEAMKRLAKNVSFSYAQDSNKKNPRITKVVVLAEGKQSAPALKRPEAPPSKKAEGPAPEPFKFEFDPSKFMEKKSR
jgi:type II secretory pathway component GspD/PulD (secretin)